jgi:BirA family transcriptional regulator, biotin operon repressor / biotin---[acetyl-CoA-carboxylase] ligase
MPTHAMQSIAPQFLHLFTTSAPQSIVSWEPPAGTHTQYFDNIPSTSAYIKEQANNDTLQPACPYLVVANTQTAGYGRYKRTWVSPANSNLYFSLLLQPHIPLEQFAGITQVAAICIVRAINAISTNPAHHLQLKWPNDIYWHGHKVAGIISELIRQDTGDYLLLGMGINVNMPPKELANLDRKATSLMAIFEQACNRQGLLHYLVQAVLKGVQTLETQGISPFIQEWRQMQFFKGAQAKWLQTPTQHVVHGTIQDINEDGSLLFLDEHGAWHTVYSGDLEV